MPKATSTTEPGRIANKRESLSSATQLAAFGVRSAKFTHRVSADTAADFSSNYDLPAACAIISVAVNVSEAYNGSDTTATVIEAGGTPIIAALTAAPSSTGVQTPAVSAQASGELSINFDANDATAGEMTVVVTYVDLSEMK